MSDLALLAKTRNVLGGHLKMKKLMISAAVAGVAGMVKPRQMSSSPLEAETRAPGNWKQ